MERRRAESFAMAFFLLILVQVHSKNCRQQRVDNISGRCCRNLGNLTAFWAAGCPSSSCTQQTKLPRSYDTTLKKKKSKRVLAGQRRVYFRCICADGLSEGPQICIIHIIVVYDAYPANTAPTLACVYNKTRVFSRLRTAALLVCCALHTVLDCYVATMARGHKQRTLCKRLAFPCHPNKILVLKYDQS